MWRSPDIARRREVCPACGYPVARVDAREYDKYGDRWDRDHKRFEYFCRPCHDALDLQRRDGLEAMLDDAGAGEVDRGTFLEQFEALCTDRSGSVERR